MLSRVRRCDPTEPLGQVLFFRACRLVAAAIVRAFYRLRVVGGENVPESRPLGEIGDRSARAPNEVRGTGSSVGAPHFGRGSSVASPAGLLLVCNHQSHLDPPLIGVALGHRNMASLARTGLFGNAALRWLLRGLGAIAIKQNESDTAAIRAAIGELKKGRIVLIFPEGSRSPDGAVHPFKRGTWLLLNKAECDVLPAAVEGAFEAWPREHKLPRLFGQRCMVAFGPPIPYAKLKALGADAALTHLASEIETMRVDLRRRLDIAKPKGATDCPRSGKP